MKYMTSGDIHRMFKQEDEGTIIRRNNVRRIALENGIKNTLTQNIILIDSKDFFEKVNPYDLQAHEYKIPKLRCIKDCAREWNKHRKTGDRFIHTDEIRDFLKTDTTVFNTLFIYLLKQITAAIFRRTVKIYNTYGFSISNIEKERGTRVAIFCERNRVFLPLVCYRGRHSIAALSFESESIPPLQAEYPVVPLFG